MKNSCVLIMFLVLVGLLAACQPVALSGGVYGTVLDKDSGEPIHNAEVVLTPGGTSTVVGSNGTYEFSRLEPGQYMVRVEAEGYEYNNKPVTVLAGENTTCDFHLSKLQGFDITPSTLNFGTTQNQLYITITNRSAQDTPWSLDLGSNSWLSANPVTGNIGVGKTQTIVFTVDRSLMSKAETAIVTLSALGNSYSLTVSCALVETHAVMSVSPTVLNFGTDNNEMTFSIKNIGNAELNWYASALTASCVSLSDKSGAVLPGSTKVVKVMLNRSQLTSDLSTSFVVSDGANEQQIQVIAVKKTATSGGGNSTDEDYSSATVESCHRDLKLEIVSCKRNGSKVEFNFKLINNGLGDLRDFRIEGNDGYKTIIFDDLGNSYVNQTLTLGSQTSYSGYNLVSTALLEGVPCKGSVVVANVPTLASYLTIKLQVYAYGAAVLSQRDYINIKNIPIY